MRCFQHWYTYKHIHTKHCSLHTNAEIHAQHLQTQCCGAVRHSSHGLNERWAFRKRRTGGVSKGAKIVSENKKNILLGV